MPTQEYKLFYNEDTKKWELFKPFKTGEAWNRRADNGKL